MKKITPIFPNLIYEDIPQGFDELKNGLIQYIYDKELQDPEGGNKSNRGGWQSKDPHFFKEDDNFQPYLNWMQGSIKEYVEFVNYTGRYDFTLETMWININRRFNYNISHHHPNSHLAGVLWLKCKENSGDLYFESPHEWTEFPMMHLQTKEFIDQYLACPSYSIKPQEGKMVIFPAHLRHYVDSNLSSDDRISIAFNMVIKV